MTLLPYAFRLLFLSAFAAFRATGQINADEARILQVVRRVFGSQISTTEVDPSAFWASNGGPVEYVANLDCNFETSCCWQNIDYGPTGAPKWKISYGQVDDRLMQNQLVSVRPGRLDAPTGNFLSATTYQRKTSKDRAFIRSCSFCALEFVNVTFRHWSSPRTDLRVCWLDAFFSDTQDLDTSEFQRQCQSVGSHRSPGPTTISLSVPSDTVVEIIFMARNFLDADGGIVAIDDVTVKARLCGDEFGPEYIESSEDGSLLDSSSSSEAAGSGYDDYYYYADKETLNRKLEQSLGIPHEEPPKFDGEVCQTAGSCTFESGTTCQYNNFFLATASWEVKEGRDRLSGIAGAAEGSLYLAASVGAEGRAFAEVDVHFTETHVIVFRAFEATHDVQLRACCFHERQSYNCPFQTELGVTPADRQWTVSAFTCPKGTRKLIFICENTGRFRGACGLDDIQLYPIPNEDSSVPLLERRCDKRF